MAWPCVSRVCCLAQFWNQLDKSDLSVPLTIQTYSHITDQQIRSVTWNEPVDREQKRGHVTPGHRDGPAAQDGGGGARANRRRADQSYKLNEDIPFPSVSQYKQDYKPWPIPKKDNFPWITNGKHSPVKQHQPRKEKDQRAGRPNSSYREEYRPWTGVQPCKPIQKKTTFLAVATSKTPLKTSYQAAFSAETHRHADISVMDMSTHSQSNILELTGSSRAEEQLVRTKLSPNTSAVFHSGS